MNRCLVKSRYSAGARFQMAGFAVLGIVLLFNLRRILFISRIFIPAFVAAGFLAYIGLQNYFRRMSRIEVYADRLEVFPMLGFLGKRKTIRLTALTGCQEVWVRHGKEDIREFQLKKGYRQAAAFREDVFRNYTELKEAIRQSLARL